MQGEVACRILERQRLRFEQRSSSLDSPGSREPRKEAQQKISHRRWFDACGRADNDNGNGNDDELTATVVPSRWLSSPMDMNGDGFCEAAAAEEGRKGQQQARGRKVLRRRRESATTGPYSGDDSYVGGGGRMTRSLSLPATTGGRKNSEQAIRNRNDTSRGSHTFHDVGLSYSGVGSVSAMMAEASERSKATTPKVTGRGRNGREAKVETDHHPPRGGRGHTTILTMQTCFKEERESFIRDLQVLHRQLEAKDRDHARREREYRAAGVRTRAESRAAHERSDLIQREADEAAVVRQAAEARAETTTERLQEQTAAAEV